VVRTQAPKGTEKGVFSFPGIRSRDVLWCAQKRAHATCYNPVKHGLVQMVGGWHGQASTGMSRQAGM